MAADGCADPGELFFFFFNLTKALEKKVAYTLANLNLHLE